MTGLSVPCPDVVHMSVDFVARHLCPFVDEVDEGAVTVSWVTSRGVTFELHALADLVASRELERVSHEQWTAELAATLTASTGVSGLVVTSVWSTAGGTVTVRSVEGGVVE
jgi:hypothetical protein